MVNLEFGLRGLLILELNQKIKSPLLSKWLFEKHKSDWNKMTHTPEGGVYYCNTKIGATQYEEPHKL